MKNLRLYFLAFFLAIPVLGVFVLAIEKQVEINAAKVVRLPIKGYDPRSLLYGHYLQFTFDGPHAPDQEAHKYFIPEDQAKDLQNILNFSRSHKVAIDTSLQNNKIVSLGMLYIDEMPWRDYFATVNAYADLAPFTRVPITYVFLSDRFLSFSFKDSVLNPSASQQSYEIPPEDWADFQKKFSAANAVFYGKQIPGQISQCGGNTRFDMDVKIKGNDVIRFGMLYIEGEPWREFDEQEALAKLEACKKNML